LNITILNLCDVRPCSLAHRKQNFEIISILHLPKSAASYFKRPKTKIYTDAFLNSL